MEFCNDRVYMLCVRFACGLTIDDGLAREEWERVRGQGDSYTFMGRWKYASRRLKLNWRPRRDDRANPQYLLHEGINWKEED